VFAATYCYTLLLLLVRAAMQVIPSMAKHYEFDYEFVTYKWPNWLHKQVGVVLQRQECNVGIVMKRVRLTMSL
jgi:hypothetical protein